MSAFADRPNTALLVIDVQISVVDGAHERDAVVATIADLVGRARAEAVPVVWIQHESDRLQKGTDAWQIVPELSPAEGEVRVEKRYGDSFEDTALAEVLAERGVGHVVVTGAQTDACVRSTLFGAFVRGYDTTLVADAHTTIDLTEWGAPPPGAVVAHTNLSWEFVEAPDRTAAVMVAAEVDFGRDA